MKSLDILINLVVHGPDCFESFYRRASSAGFGQQPGEDRADPQTRGL